MHGDIYQYLSFQVNSPFTISIEKCQRSYSKVMFLVLPVCPREVTLTHNALNFTVRPYHHPLPDMEMEPRCTWPSPPPPEHESLPSPAHNDLTPGTYGLRRLVRILLECFLNLIWNYTVDDRVCLRFKLQRYRLYSCVLKISDFVRIFKYRSDTVNLK